MKSKPRNGIVLAGAVMAAMLTTVALSAPASATNNPWEHRLRNGYGKCLGVTASGYIGQWTCTNNNDQIWHWDEYSHLLNRNNACIGLEHGQVVQGENLVTFGGCAGWTFDIGNTLVNTADDTLTIGIYGGHDNDGGGAVLWHVNTNPDQQWYFDDSYQ